MIRNPYSYSVFLMSAMFVLSACSNDDESDLLGRGKEQTWQAEVYATKDGGDITETRAMFWGGNTGTRYYSLWDSGDNAEVYYGDTKVGTFTPNSFGKSDSKLTGTLTGSNYSVGNTLNLYIPSADMDLTGQTGTLGSMSNHTFMDATSTISEVDGSGQYVDMNSATFHHRQCFYRFRFSDPDGIRLNVKKLTIHASQGKLVQTKSRTGETTYGDIVVNTVKDQNAYPDELFVALWNDYRDANDTYSFTVEADNGYVYESNNSDPSDLNTTRMTRKDNTGAFTRVHRALPLQGSAANLQAASAVNDFGNGNGEGGESGSVSF